MNAHVNTLTGQVAIVTGAGSGIGAATARFLAEAGAAVALIDLNLDGVEKLSHELESIGAKTIAIRADVSEESSVCAAYEAIRSRFGRLDIVVANAGINGFWGPLEDFSVAEWDRVLNINLRGAFLTVKHALPLLKPRGGSIIITASVNGVRMFSNTGATAYACSKAAQVAFCKMTALELARHRIRVNAVCPGSVQTNIDQSMTAARLDEIREPVEFPEGVVPLKRGEAADPLDVAKAIWFLASPFSSHITGTEMFVDGAQSLLQG